MEKKAILIPLDYILHVFRAILWEISHFDPPQAINYTHVHGQHLLMLQTANENDKEKRARQLAYIYYHKKKEKMTVSRAERERRRREKSVGKKKRTGGCGAQQYESTRFLTFESQLKKLSNCCSVLLLLAI